MRVILLLQCRQAVVFSGAPERSRRVGLENVGFVLDAPLLGASCLRTLAALCAVWKADVIVEVAASFAMPRPTIACHVALRQAGVIELVPSSG